MGASGVAKEPFPARGLAHRAQRGKEPVIQVVVISRPSERSS